VLSFSKRIEDKTMQDKWGWLNTAVFEQFGSEIESGKHDQYPALKRIWLEEKAARAEEAALISACDEVSFGYRACKD
jgi:hypothetical protein